MTDASGSGAKCAAGAGRLVLSGDRGVVGGENSSVDMLTASSGDGPLLLVMLTLLLLLLLGASSPMSSPRMRESIVLVSFPGDSPRPSPSPRAAQCPGAALP